MSLQKTIIWISSEKSHSGEHFGHIWLIPTKIYSVLLVTVSEEYMTSFYHNLGVFLTQINEVFCNFCNLQQRCYAATGQVCADKKAGGFFFPHSSHNLM